MSDEEKKAIKRIKSEQDINEFMPRLVFNCEDIEIILSLIEKQSKEIEELKKYEKYYEEMEEVNKKFISVDKIKAKIEELKAIADNGANAIRFAMTHDDEIERIQKQKDIRTMVEILQLLLEKE